MNVTCYMCGKESMVPLLSGAEWQSSFSISLTHLWICPIIAVRLTQQHLRVKRGIAATQSNFIVPHELVARNCREFNSQFRRWQSNLHFAFRISYYLTTFLPSAPTFWLLQLKGCLFAPPDFQLSFWSHLIQRRAKATPTAVEQDLEISSIEVQSFKVVSGSKE